jgi:hypothetical protein
MQKARGRFRRGLHELFDDGIMSVICPTSQLRRELVRVRQPFRVTAGAEA